MKKLFLLVLLTIVSLLGLPYKQCLADSGPEELKLLVGEIKIISVNNPKRIVVGNPDVADVTGVTKSEVTLYPKAAGTTTLVIWDNYDEMSFKVKVFAEDINVIKERVDNLLGQLNLAEVYTKAEENEGKIVLSGRVKTAQEKSRIIAATSSLKEKIIDLIEVKEEEAVVEIDVQVLEIDRDATKNLGFSWPATVGFAESGSPINSASLPKLFKVTRWARNAFSWTIDALIQEGKARVLSRPRLTCQSGKEAELLVGGERPVLTSETVSLTGAQTTSVDYKDYGIKLKIKPVVMENKRVKIGLNVEVSEIGEAIILGTLEQPTAKAWPLSKRNASTELILDDQQTLAIGGLIKRKEEEDIRKVPFLGDIPVLGALFRKKLTKLGNGQAERGDTELFITLTPTIVSEKQEPAALSLAQRKKDIKSAESAAYSRNNLGPELEGYSQVIQKQILQNLTYPPSAKEAGLQGTVRLSLHLSYKGELLDVLVKDSSGYKIIDDSAISVVKEISSYPPFPSSIISNDLWVDIPIEYQLN